MPLREEVIRKEFLRESKTNIKELGLCIEKLIKNQDIKIKLFLDLFMK